MAKLTYKARKSMPKSSFAIPAKKTASNPAGKGGYPIEDAAHARNALSRVSQFGTSTQKATVRAKVANKFPGIDKPKKKGGKKIDAEDRRDMKKGTYSAAEERRENKKKG